MSGELDFQTREAAWAIVKDSREMNETGHAAAVRWARAALELDDTETVRVSRPSGHTCGFAMADGEWRCVQDFYARGNAPETGCGVIAVVKAVSGSASGHDGRVE